MKTHNVFKHRFASFSSVVTAQPTFAKSPICTPSSFSRLGVSPVEEELPRKSHVSYLHPQITRLDEKLQRHKTKDDSRSAFGSDYGFSQDAALQDVVARPRNRPEILPFTAATTDPKPKTVIKPKPKVQYQYKHVPGGEPVPSLTISLACVGAAKLSEVKRRLKENIKSEFLSEDRYESKDNVSKETKNKITDILASNDVRSFKAETGYTLKGQKENVHRALKEILHALLKDKDTDTPVTRIPSHIKPGTNQYVAMMLDIDPTVPNHWTGYTSEKSIRNLLKEGHGRKAKGVGLVNTDSEYQEISQMFQIGFDPSLIGHGRDATGISYSALKIVSIQRIENIRLFDQFARKRLELYRKLHTAQMVSFPKIETLQNCSGQIVTQLSTRSVLRNDVHDNLNEVYLFHGTRKEYIQVICDEGFDERRCSGRAMFGQGIYGAEKAMKADQYTDSKHARENGQKYMFLMRMVLGNSYLCSNSNPPKYCRPPCTTCEDDKCNNHHHVGPLGHLYDSVTGDIGKLFREFVVYDRSLCYPEYLITYERV